MKIENDELRNILNFSKQKALMEEGFLIIFGILALFLLIPVAKRTDWFSILFIIVISFFLIKYIVKWYSIHNNISLICNYLIKEKNISKTEEIVWTNYKDCIMTNKYIVYAQKKQIKEIKYQDITEITREGKLHNYGSGGRIRINVDVYLNIALKNRKTFRIFIYTDGGVFRNDSIKYKGIDDIVPIIQQKNNKVIVNEDILPWPFDRKKKKH